MMADITDITVVTVLATSLARTENRGVEGAVSDRSVDLLDPSRR